MNDQAQQILDMINEARGDTSGPRNGSSGSGGFGVDTPALIRYANRTKDMAEELERLAKGKVGSVRDIAEDSFGKIGKESGFAAALNRFAGALGHQVKGVATNADKLGRKVARTAGEYRETDSRIADDLDRPRSSSGRTIIH